MDPSLRSNGSNTRPATPIRPPSSRSRVAGKVERVLNTALGGEKAAVLNLTAPELLADAEGVARTFTAALDRQGAGVTAHWMVHEMFRRSNLEDQLLDSLASPDPATRAAAARICGAARLTEAALWISDLVHDPIPRVREAAVRSLARFGGRRAVDEIMASADAIPLHRLAIALSKAASDVDIEALMRQPANERAAVATVLACGLRRDVLRVSPLLGIAHDRRWPKQVRFAACRALSMIGDRSAADGLHRLAEKDPDTDIQKAALRAHKRVLRRAVGRGR
jgi:HEAT repeat protein